MKISILFNGSFSGLIYSSKYAYNPDCLYVNGTGSQRYEFYIRLNRCGTLGGGPKGRNEDEVSSANIRIILFILRGFDGSGSWISGQSILL